jgi:hypothetical protein
MTFTLRTREYEYLYMNDDGKLSCTFKYPNKNGYFIKEERVIRHTNDTTYVLKSYSYDQIYPTVRSWTIELIEFDDKYYLRIPYPILPYGNSSNIESNYNIDYAYISINSIGKIELLLEPVEFICEFIKK